MVHLKVCNYHKRSYVPTQGDIRVEKNNGKFRKQSHPSQCVMPSKGLQPFHWFPYLACTWSNPHLSRAIANLPPLPVWRNEVVRTIFSQSLAIVDGNSWRCCLILPSLLLQFSCQSRSRQLLIIRHSLRTENQSVGGSPFQGKYPRRKQREKCILV